MDNHSGAPLLELDGVETYYGPLRALTGVSLRVREGAITVILGNNGAGKSTLLNTVMGVLDRQPQQGRISFRGTRIDGVATEKIVRSGISYVPEGRRLFDELTVRENLTVGGYIRRDRAEAEKARERVYEFFPLLAERSRQPAGTLSGGEQQMLAIGRALLARPRLIMLDEPSLGLSPILVKQLFHIIHQLNEDGMSILLVEQNTRMALKAAHRGYVLELGRVVMEGKPEALLADKGLHEAYLGRSEKQDMPTKKSSGAIL